MSAMKKHAPAPAGNPVRIDPDAWYTDPDLRLILRMPGTTLRRARRGGTLRFNRNGITLWHRGSWVISWLSGEDEEGAKHGH